MELKRLTNKRLNSKKSSKISRVYLDHRQFSQLIRFQTSIYYSTKLHTWTADIRLLRPPEGLTWPIVTTSPLLFTILDFSGKTNYFLQYIFENVPNLHLGKVWFLLLGKRLASERGKVDALVGASYLHFDLENSLGNWLRQVFISLLHLSAQSNVSTLAPYINKRVS